MFTSIYLLKLSCGLLEIKYSAATNSLVCLSFYYTTLYPSFFVLKDSFYNSLSQSLIFSISSFSSSCCFIHKNRLWLTFTNGFLFYHLQFSSNFFQYSCLYFLSPHPYNNFAIYLPSNSLLNTFLSFSIFCHFVSSFSALSYSFSNSFTNLLVFLRFSLLSQMSFFTVYPFYHTRYFFLSHTHLLFIIFFTSHSSFFLITMGCSISFLCPSIYSVYLLTLLTLTIRFIFTVLDSSNSIMFVKTIDLTL